MNTVGNAVLMSAVIRGFYVAIGSGATAFLTTYATTDDMKSSLIVGGITALAALGFRGGGEGLYDTSRAASGNMNAGDVAVASPKVEVVPVADVGAITVTGSVQATDGT